MSRALDFRLLAITPPVGDVRPNVLEAWAAADVASVGLAVLLREPGKSVSAMLAPDGRLGPFWRACDRAGIAVLVSTTIDQLAAVAHALDASGITGMQLRGDPSRAVLLEAREELGDAWIGRSCHGAPQDNHELVDFTCVAPVFAPNTPSAQAKQPVGVAALRAWTEPRAAKIFALGGITPATAAQCVAAGAFGLAGISTFFGPLARVEQDVAALRAAVVARS